MSKKVIVTVTSQITGNMWALSPLILSLKKPK